MSVPSVDSSETLGAMEAGRPEARLTEASVAGVVTPGEGELCSDRKDDGGIMGKFKVSRLACLAAGLGREEVNVARFVFRSGLDTVDIVVLWETFPVGEVPFSKL